MKKFLARMFFVFLVSMVALSVSVAVLMMRIIAHYGSRFVSWCAAATGIDSPFETIGPANSAPRQADPADYAAIENLINSKIPSRAERVAARDALQKLMSP